MHQSRLNKYQEKIHTKRLIWSLAGSIGLILFLWLFGLKILVGFSILADFIKGSSSPTTKQEALYVTPPVLDLLPEATNSALIDVSGQGEPDQTIILYRNSLEVKKISVNSDGAFIMTNFPLEEGENILKSKSVDDKGNKSEASNTITIIMSAKNPKLEVTSPGSDSTVTGDNNEFTITGTTDSGNTVTIHDRIIVVQPNGSFSHILKLSENENRLTIIAKDNAGNQTKVERIITYHP